MNIVGTILECASSMGKYLLFGACSGALGLPILIVTVPFLLGFTARGVRAGSPAAIMMRRHAGFIPIKSFVAMMQSIGAKGLAAGFNRRTIIRGCFLGMAWAGYRAVFQDPSCSEVHSHISTKIK